jgi:hypothetical protein
MTRVEPTVEKSFTEKNWLDGKLTFYAKKTPQNFKNNLLKIMIISFKNTIMIQI